MDAALVICVGNDFRGDDGFGPAVGRCLRDIRPDLCVVSVSGEPATLLAHLAGATTVVLVDALHLPDGVPGQLIELDPSRDALPDRSATSSHFLGVAESIELARALGQLPRTLRVLGVPIHSVDHGVGLSPAVERAVRATAMRVAELTEELAHA